MGEIGTSPIETGDMAIMVFTSEAHIDEYLKSWGEYAAVPAEVVQLELCELFEWIINKVPLIDNVAIDPSPDEDYCPRGLDVERALALEITPEEHFVLFETNFLGAMNSD